MYKILWRQSETLNAINTTPAQSSFSSGRLQAQGHEMISAMMLPSSPHLRCKKSSHPTETWGWQRDKYAERSARAALTPNNKRDLSGSPYLAAFRQSSSRIPQGETPFAKSEGASRSRTPRWHPDTREKKRANSQAFAYGRLSSVLMSPGPT